MLRYEYQTADGGLIARDELLSPEAIFDPAFIESCNGIPFVLQHPQNNSGEFVDVSPDNFNEVIKGIVINPRPDKVNGELLGTLKVFDADVKALIESGELEEVSGGYICQMIERLGKFDGQSFQAEQINMIANHLALVNEGRAGSQVRVLFNSKTTLKLKSFLEKKVYQMKKNIAEKKRNEASAAKRNAEEQKKKADEATAAAEAEVKANQAEDAEEDKENTTEEAAEKENADSGDDGDKPNNPEDKNKLLPDAKDTAAFVQNAEGMEGLKNLLMQAAEMVGAMMTPAPEAAPAALNAAPLNHNEVMQTVQNSISEAARTFSKAVSILGVERAQAANGKFNTVDEFQRYCLLATNFKSKDVVSKMNSYQVEAHFDVLTEQKKALINQAGDNKVNSVGGVNGSELGDNEEAMTMSKFTS